MSIIKNVYEIYMEGTDAVWVCPTKEIAEEFADNIILDSVEYITTSNVSLSVKEQKTLNSGECFYCNY